MIDRIIETKKKEVAAMRHREVPPRTRPVVPFQLKDGTSIIAELKRKSPSAGDIGEIDDRRIALYDQYAAAISVLTDATYFGGSFDVLADVAGKVGIPLLCKDFIIDTSQIDLAWSKGADMILLIARVLGRDSLRLLYDHARQLGLDCLVEIHEENELEKIAGLNAGIVGVNSRNLDTLAMDLDKGEKILSLVKAPVRVAESGIRSRAEIERFACANCFLIGETLMRADDLESTFRRLIYG
jgi:indole-3-glycerol phosphate synthase